MIAKTPRRLARANDEQRLAARRQVLRVLWLSLAAGAALWASFPPLNLWALAWVAPVPWLVMARKPERFGGWAYFAVWCGGFVHWLAMMQGIRLAHPALYGGWLALAWYLAFYTVLLVWLCRVAVLRCKVPLVVASPVVWTGLELVRAFMITGFSMGQLGHTQVAWTSLLQVSDFCGAYGVSFVMALVAGAIAQMIPNAWLGIAGDHARRWRLWPALPAAACLAAALAYGQYRLSYAPPPDENPLRVALIQGSLDTVFDTSREEYERRVVRTFHHYDNLTAKAIAAPKKLDLIVWPESAFASVERRIVEPLQLPEGAEVSLEDFREQLGEFQNQFDQSVALAAAAINAPSSSNAATAGSTWFLFGTTTVEYGPRRPPSFNSALLADPQGRIVERYYKMHLVMFGEYIPFGEWFPWIYDLTPLPGGLARGKEPVAMEVAGRRLSPCVCFENTVPHLIRGHIVQLTRRGTPPDILVTLTNDGWFFGTSVLDLHYRCAVFRAIENRRPMIIAANTGFSAHIDGSGRILDQGPRREPKVLIASVSRDGRTPLYHWWGDLPAILCAAACGLLAAIGIAAPWWKKSVE